MESEQGNDKVERARAAVVAWLARARARFAEAEVRLDAALGPWLDRQVAVIGSARARAAAAWHRVSSRGGPVLRAAVTHTELFARRAAADTAALARLAGALTRRAATDASALTRRAAADASALTRRAAADASALTRRAAADASALTRRAAAATGRGLAGTRERLGPVARALAERIRRLGPLPRPTAVQVVLLGGLVFGATWLTYRTCGLRGCPDVGLLTVYQPNGAPLLLDRNGEKFADLAPFERVIVPLDELPKHVADAFIAVEDRRFYRHGGVDWPRVFGAALANLRAREVTQGSSTIPMQLARNIFPKELPGTERTLRRKLLEARVAQEIEKQYTKDEILELYLNHIYFGGGAYGIAAAARRYFDRPAAELTMAQAALLAALPKAPAHYDPRRHPDRARARRDLVLSLMERQELIASDEAEAARGSDLRVPEDPPRDRSGVPLGAYFVDVVRDQLDTHLGGHIYRTGLRIHTTLDVTAQRAAERELENRLAQLDRQVRRGDGPLQGAVVVMEAHSGDVLALVGGRDPLISRYNRALLAQRQVGSAFKPFVFAAAVARGYSPGRLVLDAPIAVQVSRNDVWQPGNFDGRFDGPVTVREALVRSRNVPTVRLASAVGLGDVAGAARAAGITSRMDTTPALALGTPSITPLQMATAYSTFATLGTTATPRFIVRVEDEHGVVLWEAAAQRRPRTLSTAVAFVVTDMLRDAVDRGTGTGVRSAGFHAPAAGKTGTTSNATDVWFVGYTPDVVGAVWIGYDRPSSLGSAATGGGFAAPVWGRIMRSVYSERPQPAAWTRPDSVLVRRIDPQTGYLLADGCYPYYGYERTELFLLGHEPGYTCPTRGGWLADLWGRVTGRSDPRQQRELQRAQREMERERQRIQRERERQRREWERQQRRRGNE